MPPNRFESEVESFLEGSHGDRTHIKRADHPRLHHYAGRYFVASAGVGRALTETVIAFAGAGRALTETAIAFAGVKWAFLVHFSGAEAMPVSEFPCWGRAVVLLVSTSPCCRASCAKKFALRAHNGPKLAFSGVLGEFFRGRVAGGAVLGEFFRANRPCTQVL